MGVFAKLWQNSLNRVRTGYGALQLLYRLSRPINRLCKAFDPAENCKTRQQACLPAGLLSGQDLPPLSALPYGVWRMGQNGCEAIAAYNGLHALGAEPSFLEVAAELERRGLLFNGFGGTNLGALPELFARYGVPLRVLKRRSRDEFDAAFTHAPCGILSYWTGPTLRRRNKRWNTLHTVSVHPSPEGLLFYNAATRMPAPVHAPSIAAFLEGIGAEPVCLMLPER